MQNPHQTWLEEIEHSFGNNSSLQDFFDPFLKKPSPTQKTKPAILATRQTPSTLSSLKCTMKRVLSCRRKKKTALPVFDEATTYTKWYYHSPSIDFSHSVNTTSQQQQRRHASSSSTLFNTKGSIGLSSTTFDNPPRIVRFNSWVDVYETYAAKDYDRTSDPEAICTRLSPRLAHQIKQELNQFKLYEMNVHDSSRIHTHFFLQ
ncbi:MAG: hypothetical protein EXX96DRAFT_548218 [Benjaminiella poitrasii]|nr:MAG: hypothetical protein EXX96DRAFT_548218 [Benjaminiella poitrasii]